ncbi:MAG: hypothetical protein OXJ53_04350 [Gammaproteobacteria bacterium]|nr:hypothetical protein [Gammaproteobacteria bacterium]MDE0273400.1 hypothetical protein [Gammaproteobacteria bacterium]
MEAMVFVPLVSGAVILLIALVKVLWEAASWYGSVNADRYNFKEFMQEVRGDIKEILLKLSKPVAERGSPIRLTDLGKKVSDEVGAKEIAKGLLGDMLPEVRDKSAYDIQEYCFSHLNECDLSLSEEQIAEIKQCAFDNGIETLSVRRVIAIELRDMILSELSLELK